MPLHNSAPNNLPLLEPTKMNEFHFGKVTWNLPFIAQNPLFHINRIEELMEFIQFPLPPHRKTVYDIIFLTQGKSTRQKGLTTYTFSKNQIFVLPAYQITSHKSMSKDAKGYYLHFSAELFNNPHILNTFSFLHFLCEPIITIPPLQAEALNNLFLRLESLYKHFNRKDHLLVAAYLQTVFYELNQFFKLSLIPVKSASLQLVSQYKDALSQYVYQYHRVSDYAKLLFVSPNHLNKCVKMITNQTAQDLLDEMVILEAKSLLKYSNLQIAEIAEKLCHRSPTNFARFFKKETGFSPKEYIMQS